jgi:hypothetical protein
MENRVLIAVESHRFAVALDIGLGGCMQPNHQGTGDELLAAGLPCGAQRACARDRYLYADHYLFDLSAQDPSFASACAFRQGRTRELTAPL